jgi:hypothetical protein
MYIYYRVPRCSTPPSVVAALGRRFGCPRNEEALKTKTF